MNIATKVAPTVFYDPILLFGLLNIITATVPSPTLFSHKAITPTQKASHARHRQFFTKK